MATSISPALSSFRGTWTTSKFHGEGLRAAAVRAPSPVAKRVWSSPRMDAVNEGKGGVFAPLVVVSRNVIGKKRFSQLRGKAIALHSQVITEFCNSVGVVGKQRQALIRLAKKNGERLGFLA